MVKGRNLGGRPRKPAGTAATFMVPLKLTDNDVRILEALCKARSLELTAPVTRGALMRWLLREEAQRRGVTGVANE